MSPKRSGIDVVHHRSSHTENALTFGGLLQQLRRRAGMTQSDLALAVNFSVSHISNLEKNQRLPTLSQVLDKFIPALGLQDEPRTAHRLLELAAAARGERLPSEIDKAFNGLSGAATQSLTPQSNLPLPLLPILGREQDITTICNRLLTHQGRLLTLVGPPGIGKTTLGLAVATRLHEAFKDGVYFVPLVPVSDPAQVGPTIMSELGLSENGARTPQVRLTEYLRQKQILIFLDNFEQVLGAATLVIHLLRECPGVRFLVTSRAALRSLAEQRYKVPTLVPESAIQLFVQRAQAVEPDFVLAQDNKAAIEQICLKLDCLPLAIELIASQLDVFTPGELLNRLQQHSLDLLHNDAPGLDPRHQTLRRTIQYSYALLDAEEQTFFRQLSVFSGGFDLAAIEAIWGKAQPEATPAVELLAKLYNKSLLQKRTQSQPRFKLLETLREYALEQLHLYGEMERARRHHANYFSQLATTANPLMRGPDEIAWLNRLETDHDNLRAALGWSLNSPQDVAIGLNLAGMLWWFWYMRSYFREGLYWLELAISKDGSGLESLRAKVLQGASRFATVNRIPNYRQIARAWTEESIALYRQLDEPWNLGKSLGYVGNYAESAEEFAPLAEEARQIFRQINDAWGYAWVAIMEHVVPQPSIQHVPLEESVAMMRAIGAKTGLALALACLLGKLIQRGDYAAARVAAQESIALYEQTGEKWTRARALIILGDIFIHLNQNEKAPALYAEALLLAQQTGSDEVIEWAKRQIAALK